MKNKNLIIGLGIATAAIVAIAIRAKAYNPLTYDLNEDGVISLWELNMAIVDHANDLLPIEHLAVVAGACQERPQPFNPWWYDFNSNGKISKQELDIAMADFQANLITMSQSLQVVNLYNMSNIS